MPGVGLRTALKILTIVGDGSAFPTTAHLASYAARDDVGQVLEDLAHGRTDPVHLNLGRQR